MPTLIIQLPGLPSVEHIVREDAITLGRMKGNTIALSDSSVSLSHAKITRVGNEFFLKDLNSTNGTMLNGQSITEARLREGDQLKFGEVIAYFRLEPLAAPTPTPAVTAVPLPSAPPASTPTATPIATIEPKPMAQSIPAPAPPPVSPVVPTAATTVAKTAATVLPAPTSAAPPLRPYAPLPTTAKKKSSQLPLLVGCTAVAAGLAVAGFFAWKYFATAPVPSPRVAPASTVAVTPKPAPPKIVATSTAKPAPSLPTIPAPDNAVAMSAPDKNLAELMKSLKSPDAVVRRHAASAIYNLGPAAQDALPILPGALTDPDSDVRMWTALALVHNNVQDKATIPILVQTLQHENPTLRQVACLSLAMLTYTEEEKAVVIPALTLTATKDTNPDVANDALTSLKIIAPDLVIAK